MKRQNASISGVSYPQFLWLIAGIGVFCIIYLSWHYGHQWNALYQQTLQSENIAKNSAFNVPLNYCGDTSAGGTNTWYPVYVAYSESNLRIIRQSLCCDAFYDSSVGMIQVASFYNRSRAYQMLAALKARNFTSASVGNGEVVTASPSSRRNTCR